MNGQIPGTARTPTLVAVIQKYMAYLKSEGRAPKTIQKYQNVFDRLEDLANCRSVTKISAVNLDLVDAYKSRRVKDEAASKTIHTEVVVIRQLVNFAISRDMIAVDPLKQLKLKKPKLRPQPCWSRQQVEQIIAAAKEPQQSMLTILADTGMRVGELKWLTWVDVDFEHSFILIRAKEGWKPKTGDERAIPMTPAVRAVLERLPRKTNWVVNSPRSQQYPKGDHQMSERRLLAYIKVVLKALELRGHLHTFRHSFISNALTQGIPEAIVRKWVGHVDPEVIKHYTHILDEASQAAMRRLAGATNTLNAPKGKEAHYEHENDETR